MRYRGHSKNERTPNTNDDIEILRLIDHNPCSFVRGVVTNRNGFSCDLEAGMSIKVGCRCGQWFAAQPHLAGKTVQCPACRAPLVVPKPATHAQPVPVKLVAANPAPARPAPQAQKQPAQPVVVSCRCGQRFRAEPHLIGQAVPCPSCGSSLQVRRPAPAKAPAPAPAPLTNVFADLGDFSSSMPQQPTFAANAYTAPVPQMRAPARKRSNAEIKSWNNQISLLLGVPGIAIQIGGSVLTNMATVEEPSLLGPILSILGGALLIAGLCFYAMSKGYHPAFGALGLLSCLGLIILASLPDKLAAGGKSGSDRAEKTPVNYGLIAALGVLGLLLCGVVGVLLVPAIQSGREAAERMREKNAAEAAARAEIEARLNTRLENSPSAPPQPAASADPFAGASSPPASSIAAQPSETKEEFMARRKREREEQEQADRERQRKWIFHSWMFKKTFYEDDEFDDEEDRKENAESRKELLEDFLEFHEITLEELQAIEAEGIAKQWPK